MMENFWAVGGPPRTRPGKLTVLPQTLAGGEGLAAPPTQELHSALGLRPRFSAVRSWPPITNPGRALAFHPQLNNKPLSR